MTLQRAASWHRPLARIVVLVLLGGVVAAGVRVADEEPAQAEIAVAGTPDGPGGSAEPTGDTVAEPEWDKAPAPTTTTAPPTTEAPVVETTTTTAAVLAEEPAPTTPEPTAPPPTVPPVTTARITVINEHPTPLDVSINGISLRVEPGQQGSMVVEADPAGDGLGNDTISAMVVDVPGCGLGDSYTWFTPGGRYVVRFFPRGDTCVGDAEGVPIPDMAISAGLSTTG